MLLLLLLLLLLVRRRRIRCQGAAVRHRQYPSWSFEDRRPFCWSCGWCLLYAVASGLLLRRLLLRLLLLLPLLRRLLLLTHDTRCVTTL